MLLHIGNASHKILTVHYQRPLPRNPAPNSTPPYNLLMNDAIDSLNDLLLNSILPNLKAVKISQAEQIAANDRLEQSIDQLRTHLNSEFAKLSAQLIACRSEMAVLHATLQTLQSRTKISSSEESKRIH